MLVFSIRDTYLTFFKPKAFLHAIRNRRHRYLSPFPFLGRFISYPDESFILQINKVILPIQVIFLISGLVFVLIQITIGAK
jgi:hypothetical protein